MTLLIKNSYNFVANIFWQIADDKKTIPNFKLIQQSTKHDMLCHIKTKTHSWGFCKKQELLMPQKTASLAKFIINMSNIEKYDNCIVCYKVGYNEADEKRETALEQHINNPKIEAAMQTELYAYVMLLNGTICPDMGECVGDFDTIYSLLVQMAKKYEVEYIYFTFDIASLFFNIFELFNYAKHHDSNMSYAKHKLLYKRSFLQ